jgi:hypothetical protein
VKGQAAAILSLWSDDLDSVGDSRLETDRWLLRLEKHMDSTALSWR